MSDNRIRVGDLVVAIKWPCCGKGIGKIFRVEAIKRSSTITRVECSLCRTIMPFTPLAEDEKHYASPIKWLKKIPPSDELLVIDEVKENMPKVVEPKVFLIAETRMVEYSDPQSTETGHDECGYYAFLQHLGVPNWATDASSDAEQLIEVAGKSCYLSFSTDLNKNLTRVGARNNQEYIRKGLLKLNTARY